MGDVLNCHPLSRRTIFSSFALILLQFFGYIFGRMGLVVVLVLVDIVAGREDPPPAMEDRHWQNIFAIEQF